MRRRGFVLVFVAVAALALLLILKSLVRDRSLRTVANRIVRADGTPWMGRGVNIPDTRSCGACPDSDESASEVERRIDEAVDVWRASFIRLLLRSDTPAESVLFDPAYLERVKRIVSYVGTKRDVYVLVSFWHEASLSPEGWPTEETVRVWTRLATELHGEDHALYGIANEPRDNLAGTWDAEVWRRMNDVVLAIRDVEARLGGRPHVVVVQGTRDYGRWLDYYVGHPITAGGGQNVAYETHPYSPAAELERMIAEPARTLPVIIGEFGPNDFGTPDFQMTIDDARAVLEIAERASIPYAAFSFHMRCPPNLLEDRSNGGCGVGMPLEPTPIWGRLVRDFLKERS